MNQMEGKADDLRGLVEVEEHAGERQVAVAQLLRLETIIKT